MLSVHEEDFLKQCCWLVEEKWVQSFTLWLTCLLCRPLFFLHLHCRTTQNSLYSALPWVRNLSLSKWNHIASHPSHQSYFLTQFFVENKMKDMLQSFLPTLDCSCLHTPQDRGYSSESYILFRTLIYSYFYMVTPEVLFTLAFYDCVLSYTCSSGQTECISDWKKEKHQNHYLTWTLYQVLQSLDLNIPMKPVSIVL